MCPNPPLPNLSLIFVTFICLMSGGCSMENIMRSNEEMRAAIKSDPKKMKDELAPRITETKNMGPSVQETPPEVLRKQQRTLLGKPEQSENEKRDLSGFPHAFKITMNFSNAGIRDIAQAFSQITGTNVVVGEEVQTRVTARLDDVPWEVALDTLLKLYGLARTNDIPANIIRIHKLETLVARDEADRKSVEDLRKIADARRSMEPRRIETFRLYYAKPVKIRDEILGLFKTISPAGAAVAGNQVEAIVNERTNTLVVRGTQGELDLIASLIEKMDVRTGQILIEAFIVEALDNFQEEFGARLGYMRKIDRPNPSSSGTFGGGLGTTAAGTPANIPGDLNFANNSGLLSNTGAANPLGSFGVLLSGPSSALKVELAAMEKLGLSKVVSNPRVFTMDNEEASITDGTQIAYPVPVAGSSSVTYEFKDAALKLLVLPSIVGDGNILLTVTVNKDSPNYSTTPPGIDKREIKSKLLIKDGTIAVIGGIFTQTRSDNVNKVPLLGDLPILGPLFRYNQQQNNRRELYIFLSPSII